jgi:hypothetical protein
MIKIGLVILLFIGLSNMVCAQRAYYATYYNPGRHLLSTGKQPKGDWCAIKNHQSERAIILTRGGTYRFRVLDRCPLKNRCDFPKKTFIKIFGHKGLKQGKIKVLIKFEKIG